MTSSPAPADTERDNERPSLLRRSRRHVPNGVWYGLGALALALLVAVAQLLLYQRRREPRDTLAIVDRELRMNTLLPGEKVAQSVAVFRRSSMDYFRATRGTLVLTDRRLIFLGAPPRDITGPSGAPPTFVQRDFPIDTLVEIDKSFSVLGMSRALTIDGPDGSIELAIASGNREASERLRQAWEQRHKQRYALGVWAGRVRDARAQLGKILEEYRRQPVYHTVRPGDAISSIASWYEISPDEIRRLNGIQGNTIKVGQQLLIRRGK